ncbi:uncharacterized protein LOC143256316 isoform X2 [Tachypleus tridentatus]|uniref:uncharacterized protein LOC143256316 isoform X2 n=1 Tax=Tachypleus tridentatus TaxID=6853 RepID=UPI003FD2E3A1
MFPLGRTSIIRNVYTGAHHSPLQFGSSSLSEHIDVSDLSEMASRSCKHSPDAFCYVCGQFIKTRAKNYSVTASAKTCEAYKVYFSMPVGIKTNPGHLILPASNAKNSIRMEQRGKESHEVRYSKNLV